MESSDAAILCNRMWEDLGKQIAAAIPDIVIADNPAKAIRWATAAEACFWKATGECDTHDVKDALPLFSTPQESVTENDHG
jgi:hypothetical protein